MSEFSINILHLYPDLLNLYGDRGNIECLKMRLMWRGIDVNVRECALKSENLDLTDIDLIFLGGGADREQEIVLNKLLPIKDELKEFVEDGKTFLALCGGYPLVGKSYKTEDKEIECLNLIDITTEEINGKRFTGNIILKSPQFENYIVGFENHNTKTDIKAYTPLGNVEKGFGGGADGTDEGVVYKNLIGTYLHGPLLPKNPELCDFILQNTLKTKYSNFSELESLDDTLENLANNYIVQVYNR